MTSSLLELSDAIHDSQWDAPQQILINIVFMSSQVCRWCMSGIFLVHHDYKQPPNNIERVSRSKKLHKLVAATICKTFAKLNTVKTCLAWPSGLWRNDKHFNSKILSNHQQKQGSLYYQPKQDTTRVIFLLNCVMLGSMLIFRGHYMTPSKTKQHFLGEILQKLPKKHTFAINFDIFRPTKDGSNNKQPTTVLCFWVRNPRDSTSTSSKWLDQCPQRLPPWNQPSSSDKSRPNGYDIDFERSWSSQRVGSQRFQGHLEVFFSTFWGDLVFFC